MPQTKLTDEQLQMIDKISDADLEWRAAKESVQERVKRLVELELEEYAKKRRDLVIQGYYMRIPKVRLRQDGLHSTNYELLESILRTVSPVESATALGATSVPTKVSSAAPVTVEPASTPALSWVMAPDVVSIHWPHFPTLSEREGFPEVLTGVVKRDSAARSGWSVVSDPTDQDTEYGAIPGFLRDEIDRNWFPEEEPEGSHLPTEIEKWAQS